MGSASFSQQLRNLRPLTVVAKSPSRSPTMKSEPLGCIVDFPDTWPFATDSEFRETTFLGNFDRIGGQRTQVAEILDFPGIFTTNFRLVVASSSRAESFMGYIVPCTNSLRRVRSDILNQPYKAALQLASRPAMPAHVGLRQKHRKDTLPIEAH